MSKKTIVGSVEISRISNYEVKFTINDGILNNFFIMELADLTTKLQELGFNVINEDC